jgi:hypothetical protein
VGGLKTALILIWHQVEIQSKYAQQLLNVDAQQLSQMPKPLTLNADLLGYV